MNIAVVDTNVLITANKAASHATDECVNRSIEALESIYYNGRIALDDGDEIFSEYRVKSNLSGQPGVGDKFLQWVFRIMYVEAKCERVVILPHPDRGYEEFPEDSALATFDRSDRKFVAVALSSSGQPPILVAGDRGWRRHHEPLARNGVTVEFLCDEIRQSRR